MTWRLPSRRNLRQLNPRSQFIYTGAVFRRVVLIPARDLDGDEIGLVTNETHEEGKGMRLTVFVPSAPTPTSGRLVLVDAGNVRPINMTVNEALKTLVSVGAMDAE